MELENAPGNFLKRALRSDIRTLDSDVSIISSSSIGNTTFGATLSSASSSVRASSSGGLSGNVLQSDKERSSIVDTDDRRNNTVKSTTALEAENSDDSDNDSNEGGSTREQAASPNMMPPLGLWLDSVRLGSFVVQLRSLPGGGVATLTQLLALQAHEVIIHLPSHKREKQCLPYACE